jgi:hypothetical protein
LFDEEGAVRMHGAMTLGKERSRDSCPEGGFGGCTYMSLTEIEEYSVKAP